jgi:hypothetical protein
VQPLWWGLLRLVERLLVDEGPLEALWRNPMYNDLLKRRFLAVQSSFESGFETSRGCLRLLGYLEETSCVALWFSVFFKLAHHNFEEKV